MSIKCPTAKVIPLVGNDVILINTIRQNIDKENECFFLIEIPLIEIKIKWI